LEDFMSRIGTGLLLALSFTGSIAHATVPEASADVMLERTVGFQIETYRSVLSAMDRENEGWREKEQFASHLESADTLLDSAAALHQSGDDERAIQTLGKAWREIGPAAKSWGSGSSVRSQRALVGALGSTTEERMRMMRSYDDVLPEEAVTALDRAREAHSASKSQRESDPAQSLSSERQAILALNKSFQLMWQDYQGDAEVIESEGDVAAPAARRR